MEATRHEATPSCSVAGGSAESGAQELTTLLALDLPALRSRIEHEDGGPVLVVDDGDAQIGFSPDLPVRRGAAILGAQRLAATALAYATELHHAATRDQRVANDGQSTQRTTYES
jgi:hypothetical protein